MTRGCGVAPGQVMFELALDAVLQRTLPAARTVSRQQPAERDIALLSLRGSRISDIAKMRNTSEGTVKAQLSAVYHKSGINTRSELLAFFMDEFLDYASVDEVSSPKAAIEPNAGRRIPSGSVPLTRHI